MIKKTFYWILFFFICFALQTTLIRAIPVYGIKPDLLIVALFILSTRMGVLMGVYIGFLLGLVQDLYSPAILGQNAMAKAIIGYIAGFFNDRVIRLDPILKGVLLVILFLVNDAIVMFVQIAKTDGTMSVVFSELVVSSLPRAVYSLLFAALPFFWEALIQPSMRR